MWPTRKFTKLTQCCCVFADCDLLSERAAKLVTDRARAASHSRQPADDTEADGGLFSVVVSDRNSHGVTSVRRSCISSGFNYKKAIQAGKWEDKCLFCQFLPFQKAVMTFLLHLPFFFCGHRVIWVCWQTNSPMCACMHKPQARVWANKIIIQLVFVSGKSGIPSQMEGLLLKVSIDILLNGLVFFQIVFLYLPVNCIR